MNLEQLMALLRLGVEKRATDIHLEVGHPPTLRIRGELFAARRERLSAQETMTLAQQILRKDDDPFLTGLRYEVDRGFGIPNVARVRASIFWQRRAVGLVLRIIPLKVPPLASLGLPEIVESIAWARSGLVLVTGATGNGKSTTIASLLDHANHNARVHILTVEDPIEYLISPEKSVVVQREVGVDTDSYASALRAALRQDPDIIMVGELRDYETADTCLKAAETGHLVISSLHTQDVQRTIGRFVGIFTGDEQASVRHRLADNLKAIVCQRLVERADGNGLVPAVEILLATRAVQDAIRDPAKIETLPELMQKGHDDVGMQTFEQHLVQLTRSGAITRDTAVRVSTRREEIERHLLMTG